MPGVEYDLVLMLVFWDFVCIPPTCWNFISELLMTRWVIGIACDPFCCDSVRLAPQFQILVNFRYALSIAFLQEHCEFLLINK